MGKYVHALKFKSLTPMYDFLIRTTMRENKFRDQFIDSLNLRGDEKVLDIGCGTGSLLILMKERFPKIEATGIDGDSTILKKARAKSQAKGLSITFQSAFSTELPYENEQFDIVVSSLMFHHLTRSQKLASFEEADRVLKKNGSVHILDWSTPSNKVMRILFYSVQLLDGFETTTDNVEGALLKYLETGFSNTKRHSPFNTVFGTLAVHSGSKRSSKTNTENI